MIFEALSFFVSTSQPEGYSSRVGWLVVGWVSDMVIRAAIGSLVYIYTLYGVKRFGVVCNTEVTRIDF
jgi:hypothetical protein